MKCGYSAASLVVLTQSNSTVNLRRLFDELWLFMLLYASINYII